MKTIRNIKKKQQEEIHNLTCPFCLSEIKGKIPDGLMIKKMIGICNSIIQSFNKIKTI